MINFNVKYLFCGLHNNFDILFFITSSHKRLKSKIVIDEIYKK